MNLSFLSETLNYFLSLSKYFEGIFLLGCKNSLAGVLKTRIFDHYSFDYSCTIKDFLNRWDVLGFTFMQTQTCFLWALRIPILLFFMLAFAWRSCMWTHWRPNGLTENTPWGFTPLKSTFRELGFPVDFLSSTLLSAPEFAEVHCTAIPWDSQKLNGYWRQPNELSVLNK